MLALKGIHESWDLDETEQPLQILLNTVLAKSFKLHNENWNMASVLREYLDELDQGTDLLSAWQRPSFYEWIVSRFKEHEAEFFATTQDLFAALFRSNKEVSHAALDITNFTPMSGKKIHLPPVRIPLIPVAYRFSRGQKTADEVTVPRSSNSVSVLLVQRDLALREPRSNHDPVGIPSQKRP